MEHSLRKRLWTCRKTDYVLLLLLLPLPLLLPPLMMMMI
jgi:hypothetical protein